MVTKTYPRQPIGGQPVRGKFTNLDGEYLSAGSVAFHQVSELMFSLTVRALPSAMAAWIAVGSMADCQSAK
jgi:hypothetical protein